ncbi:MAG: tRNA (N6-threonylcarbamoyladenosine(37)-N6)-methyltransferase TrmO [Hyphomicrobiaceae bacterium]
MPNPSAHRSAVAYDGDMTGPSPDGSDLVLRPIGVCRTPWARLADTPKNMREARERGGGARLEIDPAWRAGLEGLAGFTHVIVVAWFAGADRTLPVQHPRHLSAPRGVFALRSPARPNPLGVSVARLMAVDQGAGLVEIDALDVLDGTPLIDLKPYFPSVDSVADARTPQG